MMWDEDIFSEEKLSMLDAIIKFSNKFRDKTAEEISLRELINFIDEFFEFDKYCSECSNLKISCTCMEDPIIP